MLGHHLLNSLDCTITNFHCFFLLKFIKLENTLNCINCFSGHCVRYGKSKKNIQVWYCKDCTKRFQDKPPIDLGLRYDSKFIVYALDLYFTGLSLRKTTRILNDHFKQKLDHATIYYWIKKYIPQITKSMEDLIVNNEIGTLHIDEVFVKTRGTDHPYNIGYLWNIIDSKTRFLLVSELTKNRNAPHITRLVKKALSQLKNKPSLIVTDMYAGYRNRIPLFGIPYDVGTLTHAKNNRVERLNGTQRERIKIQRGWKVLDTVIPNGMLLDYNYIKPHMGLNGSTPGEAMGVFDRKQTWQDLWNLIK